MMSRSVKKFFESPWPYFAGFLLLSVFMFHSRVVFVRAWNVWQENKELEQKQQAMAKKNNELAAEVDYARSAGFQEREGKSRLNLKRPGEEVVVIVPEKESATSSGETAPGFWRRLAMMFGF